MDGSVISELDLLPKMEGHHGGEGSSKSRSSEEDRRWEFNVDMDRQVDTSYSNHDTIGLDWQG
jgi:hypothetical protein